LSLVCRVTTPADRVALIGVGASTLVLKLVAAGYSDINAVDVSGQALQQLRGQLIERFGTDDVGVRFIEADVRTVSFEDQIDLWHDRATFHFLVGEADQEAYVDRAARAVRSGGHVILAGFSAEGPQHCSGLDVARHTGEGIDRLFAGSFTLIDRFDEIQETPSGAGQSFTYSLMRRT
jgi:ubiquinone/menaquinone biosynthesis C-methylase UbiE